ncbi:hypothetical protein TWF192_004459 [Orbilia oligospora]|uniref:Uncharacterized protein n=1 Tax=Orbilia oligospora TaxID=2813651 RepID=A0A6G1MBA7_ORBOL|nr:hypothetical protein TWF679_008331 [Orbilia oligospora]KAF3229001.1 hypothetical protein TWF191_002110 [Orbilia oligospora]KAF3252658.1 hypothetical protein TWF192_004459 [Orbilia oligospora]
MATPHHPPKTPTTHSIRNFMTRTSAITPTTLASTYRRNSRCPHPPTSSSPIDIDIDIDIKTPTASSSSSSSSSISSSFQPRGNIMTTTPRSINQIATYLRDNYGTPTKSRYYSSMGIKNSQQDSEFVEEYGYKTPVQKGREDVDRELERSAGGFTPIVPLPSSVTIRKRRGSPGSSCFSGGGDSNSSSSSSSSVGAGGRNKRGFYDEEGIPSIEDSMEELPDHPVYKFRRTSASGGGGRSVSGEKDVEMGDVKDIETSGFKDIVKRPSTSSSSTSSTSPDQKSDPSLTTSTPFPIFHSPTPNTGITNKENIDPITLTSSSSPSSSSPSSIIFNTPTSHTPDPTRHLLLYDQSRQKDIFSKKKLEAIKSSSSGIPHSSYTYKQPSSSSSSVIKQTTPFVVPNNAAMGWGISLPSPSNPQDTSTLPDNITPTPTPSSSNSNIPATIKRHRSSSTGTPQTNTTFPFTFPGSSSSISKIPRKTGLISKLGLQNKTSSTGPKIPVTPTPQKLLHKSAKSTTSHNYHYNYTSSSSNYHHLPQTPTPTPNPSISTRNSKKLEDLKMRFPRSMYPLNGKKKSNTTTTNNTADLLKLARGESTLNNHNGISSGNEPDSNEWTDRDIQRFELEKGKIYGEDVEMKMVDA